MPQYRERVGVCCDPVYGRIHNRVGVGVDFSNGVGINICVGININIGAAVRPSRVTTRTAAAGT